jgi:hypothetical protein
LEELQRDPGTVFFLQEVNFTVITVISQMIQGTFKICYNDSGSTAIVYPAYLTDHEQLQFPTDGDTFLHEEICVLRCYDNVYISVHCSAKTKEKATKIGKSIYKNMEDQLRVLKDFIKSFKGLRVIVGGDFNQRLTSEKIGTDMIFPKSEESTTSKERSGMQAQFEKIKRIDTASKDCICFFEKVEVQDCRVRTLYKDQRAFCSYALDWDAGASDENLVYPFLLQCPDYENHFPDHFVVEVVKKM